MTKGQKLALVAGVGAGAWFLFSRTASASTTRPKQPLLPGQKAPGKSIASSLASSLPKALVDLLDKLKGSGSGSGIGGGSGSGSAASGGGKTGGPGQSGDLSGRSGNFGDYVVGGQVYDAFGRGIDADGRVIPGFYDNTGLGPAGAGINEDGSIASDPLEFSDGPLYGVVAPLNNVDAVNSGYLFLPGDLGSGDSEGLLASARASDGDTFDPDVTQALLPSQPLPNLNGPDFYVPGPDTSANGIPDNVVDGGGAASVDDWPMPDGTSAEVQPQDNYDAATYENNDDGFGESVPGEFDGIDFGGGGGGSWGADEAEMWGD